MTVALPANKQKDAQINVDARAHFEYYIKARC
jgi:hypothetical protein